LLQEKSSIIFAHASDGLAKIEEESSSNILKEDVHEVGDLSARWLLDMTIRAVTKNVDNIAVVQSLENLDLLLH